MFLTKRQRQIYEFVKDHIQRLGFAPSIMEIARRFKLSSPATVHKHLGRLEAKGLIRRQQNLSRAIELVDSAETSAVPLLGRIAAGRPIEAVGQEEMISLLPDLAGKNVYVLRVAGDSMIEDHIQDGDYVIVESRHHARNGEVVVALLDGQNATLKRFYREPDGSIRLQPANREMDPIRLREGEVQIQGVVIGVLRKF